ncbi:MAG: bis(5'-nucleosyl)-tetraphosphatase (symmetrical) YqeK [Ruminococcus sp.]
MDFNYLKGLIKPRMGEHRYIHSVNVSKKAVELAKIYGCDEEKAMIAGMLHDITKETPVEEQLKIITEGGIILDDVEKSSTKLWHPISGSVYIRDIVGITDSDIINSVRYHTTGRAGMSLLEKIIFVADFTGDERNYDGVDIMREKSLRSLEEAMLYGLQFTINDLSKRMMTIHPNALACYNELLLKDETNGN